MTNHTPSPQDFVALADFVEDIIWLCGADGMLLWANAGALTFTGKTRAELEGAGYFEILDVTQLANAQQSHGQSLNETWHSRLRVRRHDGEWVLVDVAMVPRIDSENVRYGFLGVARTGGATNAELGEGEALAARARALDAALGDNIVVFDESTQSFSIGISEAGGRRADDSTDALIDAASTAANEAWTGDGIPFETEYTSGEKNWKARVGSHQGIVVAVLDDVTQHHHEVEALAYAASHDSLTGLGNRAYLVGALDKVATDAAGGVVHRDLVNWIETGDEHEIENGRQDPTMTAVMLLDLDRFKVVNDGLGHHAGDELLRQVAKRIVACVRDSDLVVRMGGDEFVVVLGVLGAQAVQAIAKRIIEALDEPFTIEGRAVYISASAGIAFADTTSTEETLLRDADSAMYAAKERGRSQAVVFDSELRDHVVRQLDIEHALPGAIANQEFELYYQPYVDLASGKVAGCEALLRWQHSELGDIGPDEFIPIAEEIGVSTAVGDWVLNEAVAQAKAWYSLGAPVRVFVNLSGRQFQDPDLTGRILQVLAQHEVPSAVLGLEITETELISEGAENIVAIDELRANGIRIAIDDFGTGYASLTYLTRFPADVIKIDKSFVAGLHEAVDGTFINDEIVAAVCQLASRLGRYVIGEGVENVQQLGRLRELGCDAALGYLFSKPGTASDITAILTSGDSSWEHLFRA